MGGMKNRIANEGTGFGDPFVFPVLDAVGIARPCTFVRTARLSRPLLSVRYAKILAIIVMQTAR